MLTGVVLARNEEAHIAECLDALRPHVEQLIVIDMESRDRTVELARPRADLILSHPLVAEFDAARNLAIPESKHDWLWFIDADERVSARTAGVVRQLVRDHGHEFEAIVIPFKSYFCGQWMRHCGWWPGYTMPRVLKRGAFEFVGRLHGGVQVRGRQVRLPPDSELGIDHFSYQSIEHYLEKLNRYTSTEAAHLAAAGHAWDWRDAVREMVRDLWMYYEYNPGRLDGERGWILSWLSGQYRWLSRAKLIDQAPQDPDQPTAFRGAVPENLDEVLALWRNELAALRSRRPELPLGIVWRSPVYDPSGYADEARAFVKALAGGERELCLSEIDWSDKRCNLQESDIRLLRALSRAERPRHVATITDCIPTLVEPDPHAALNILRTTFETDRIPHGWLDQLVKFNEVWVPSQQNYRAFRRSGYSPERLRVVPSCYDEELYQPQGPKLALPPPLEQSFVFLSVFDWQLRKGWDVLLRAYVQEFRAEERVGLLLKITRAHGHTLPLISAQIDALLAEVGQALVQRPDIVVWDQSLAAGQMAELYRSASAFVLPTRGEGWGRPFMEAMACGLPVIGTRHTGSADFLTDENSWLIDASLVDVPVAAAQEIALYRGHKWYEPDLVCLRRAMRAVFENEGLRTKRAAQAAAEMPARFGLAAGRRAIVQALEVAEERFRLPQLPAPEPNQVRVMLEGELFAHHSFANVNEQLALVLGQDPRLALSLARIHQQPTYDEQVPHAWRLQPYVGRSLGEPQVTIRHAFPPNWAPVPRGKWVHIQPWEFGYLPADWVAPLQNQVDECWVPTHYVRQVFERSGIPPEKIQVIPWGVDPSVFTPAAEPLLLPTDKSFRFLFVGGLIGRKGFDTLLAAYLAEFGPDDDVCLVVKDLGSETFYRYGNFREQLLAAIHDPASPRIVYLQEPMTSGQLASLYTACQCLAAPYRAEGFGLPILEGMACGLVPIVSWGGAADDFTSPEMAYLLSSQEMQTTHDWQLTGPPQELFIAVDDVRRALRLAYEDRQRTSRLGRIAAEHVQQHYTWAQTADRMAARILDLSSEPSQAPLIARPLVSGNGAPAPPRLAACLVSRSAERLVGGALAQVTPFVDETLVVVAGEPDRAPAIAREYGARVVLAPGLNGSGREQLAEPELSAHWVFWLEPTDRLAEEDIERLRGQITGLPPQVSEILVELPRSSCATTNGAPATLRVMRRQTSPTVPSPV